jgi:hypothetical protein
MPPQGGCICDPETPVPLLCPDCLDNRRRIRDRINRRKARATARGQTPRPLGTAVLPTGTVIDLADALDSVTDVLADAHQDERDLTPLEQQLVYNLQHLHSVLQDALRPATDELHEAGRNTSQYPTEYQGKRPKFAGGE